MNARDQISLALDPTVAERWESIADLMLHIYNNSKKAKGDIARDCDMSPSALSRVLNRHEQRTPTTDVLERFMRGVLPEDRAMLMDYLIGNYSQSPATEIERAARFINEHGADFYKAIDMISKHGGVNDRA
ncbi:MAG: hypothetical protein AAF384_19680 [Pseudomonadota bacterium]